MSKYGVFLVRIFMYLVRIQENTDQKKNLYLDTFHVMCLFQSGRGWNFLEAHGRKKGEHCQIFKMERFAKAVDGLKPWTIFGKRTILDVWQGSDYTSRGRSASNVLWKGSGLCLVWPCLCIVNIDGDVASSIHAFFIRNLVIRKWASKTQKL